MRMVALVVKSVFQAKGSRDDCLEQGVERFASDLLQDESEVHEVEIRVKVCRARCIQNVLSDASLFSCRVGGVVGEQWRDRVSVKAARVSHQLFDGDARFAGIGLGELWHIGDNCGIDRQVALET